MARECALLKIKKMTYLYTLIGQIEKQTNNWLSVVNKRLHLSITEKHNKLHSFP